MSVRLCQPFTDHAFPDEIEGRIQYVILSVEMPVNARGDEADSASHGSNAQPLQAVGGIQAQHSSYLPERHTNGTAFKNRAPGRHLVMLR